MDNVLKIRKRLLDKGGTLEIKLEDSDYYL